MSFIVKDIEKIEINSLQENNELQIRKYFISSYKLFLLSFSEISIMQNKLNLNWLVRHIASVDFFLNNDFFKKLTKVVKYKNKKALKNKYIEILNSHKSFDQEFVDELMCLKISKNSYSGYIITNVLDLSTRIYNLSSYISSYTCEVSELTKILKKEYDNIKSEDIISLSHSILEKQNKIETQFNDLTKEYSIKNFKYKNKKYKELQTSRIIDLLQNIKNLKQRMESYYEINKQNNACIAYESYLFTLYLKHQEDCLLKQHLFNTIYSSKISYIEKTYIIIAINISFIFDFMNRYLKIKYSDYEIKKLKKIKKLIDLNIINYNIYDLFNEFAICFNEIIIFKFDERLLLENNYCSSYQKKLFLNSFYYILMFLKANIYNSKGENEVKLFNLKNIFFAIVYNNIFLESKLNKSIKLFKHNLKKLIAITKKLK